MKNIINLREYGDLKSLKQDANTLRDILSRQGNNFVIDVLADCTGNAALEFQAY